MAQVAISPVVGSVTMVLTAEELHEIRECEKIVHFRDAVLSGTHPRVKVPTHLLGKPSNANRHGSSPNSLTPRQNPPAASQIKAPSNSPSLNAYEENTLYNCKASNVQRVMTGKLSAPIPKLPKAAKSEINPILLEKSDDLIKAEIQLQRQRLERALREQIEQRRISVKASLQTSESLPDFDISEVLSKALTIVHPSMANEAEQPVGDQVSAISDSFDENTFYSSQHDTPEQSIASQGHHEPAEARLEDVTVDARLVESDPTMTHDKSRDIVMADISLSNIDAREQEATRDQPLCQISPKSIEFISSEPHITTTDAAQLSQKQGSSNNKSHTAPEFAISARSDEMSGLSSKTPDEPADLGAVQTGALLKRKFCDPTSIEPAQPIEPTIIRTRDDLSPIAPQPARVSPLATARAPPIIEQSITADEALTASVTIPRKPSDISSRDSSPKGTKPPKARKVKKSKKGKTKQVAADNTPDSPFIKPEPQSPSPLGTAPLPRPHKRQRQTLHQGPELNYDEPRYEVSREEPQDPQGQIERPRHRNRAPRPLYHIPEDGRVYEPRDLELSGYRRVGRDENQYRRIVSHESYKDPRSPVMYVHPSEPRPIRAASHSITERHMQDPPRYYRDPNPPTRATICLDGDDERSRSPIIIRDRRSPVLMAPPPRVPSTRIVIDEYGHQYFAPAPAPVSRQSVAPAIRAGGDDIVYERYAPSTTSLPKQSVAPATRPTEEDLVYERYPPVRPPVSSRQSVTPANRPGGDDVIYERYAPGSALIPRQSVAPPVRPGEDDLIYERAPRRPLAQPATEIYEEDGILYRRSPPYPPRRIVSQAEPEADYRPYRQREYSIRPVTMAPPSDEYVRIREPLERRQMSVRPSESEFIRREYLPAPEGYVAARPVARRVIERAEYIERPRGISYDAYADDMRREVVQR